MVLRHVSILKDHPQGVCLYLAKVTIIELKNARWNNEIRKCPTSKTLQRLQKHQAEATENK